MKSKVRTKKKCGCGHYKKSHDKYMGCTAEVVIASYGMYCGCRLYYTRKKS